jgi:hypothetical protein
VSQKDQPNNCHDSSDVTDLFSFSFITILLDRYNWLWVLFCSLIFAGSICDTYFNREYIKLYFQGQEINIPAESWIYILIIPWGAVFVSILSIVLNHFLRKSCELRVQGGKFVLLGWRQAEGLVAFIMTCKLVLVVV